VELALKLIDYGPSKKWALVFSQPDASFKRLLVLLIPSREASLEG
jgi:hypothetical protein